MLQFDPVKSETDVLVAHKIIVGQLPPRNSVSLNVDINMRSSTLPVHIFSFNLCYFKTPGNLASPIHVIGEPVVFKFRLIQSQKQIQESIMMSKMPDIHISSDDEEYSGRKPTKRKQ